MKKFIITALVAVFSFVSISAEAKSRKAHRVHKAPVTQQWSGPDWFGQWQGFSAIKSPSIDSGSSKFIRGRLICAVNVNAELASRGIKGTGSAMARSFQRWGMRTHSPSPGDVAVFSRGKRGGHVAIYAGKDERGRDLYKNPSARRQAWVVGPYHRRPIEFRTAS